jgi:hypothetical protein
MAVQAETRTWTKLIHGEGQKKVLDSCLGFQFWVLGPSYQRFTVHFISLLRLLHQESVFTLCL